MALALRLVYGLPWRQTEGLLRSLMRLLGLDLSVPDHTTLSRRARDPRVALPARRRSDALHLIVDATGLKVFGQGEWAAWKYGARRAGPGWRKLHVGVDADGFIADGAYDGRFVYEAVLWAGPAPKIVTPTIRTAVVAGSSEPMLAQRDAAIELIRQAGRRRWKKTAAYHQQTRGREYLLEVQADHRPDSEGADQGRSTHGGGDGVRSAKPDVVARIAGFGRGPLGLMPRAWGRPSARTRIVHQHRTRTGPDAPAV